MRKQILLISEDYIKTYTSTTDNVAGDFITPSILIAQDLELEPTIGTELYNKIIDLVDNDTISNDENSHYKTLLDDYIQPMVCHYTITHLLQNTSVKMTNFGVMKSEDEKMYNIDRNEVQSVKDYYTHIGDFYKLKLQNYLISNYSLFPELSTNDKVDEIKANLTSAASSNVWLGGLRGKIIK